MTQPYEKRTAMWCRTRIARITRMHTDSYPCKSVQSVSSVSRLVVFFSYLLKLTLIFTVLVLATPTPVIALEDNHIRIDNVTSISSIVNPAIRDLARSVNAAPEWRNFIPPQAFWSPDGKKLFIRSTIGWYPDDIDFRPANRNGIGAIYIMDADGTNLTKIISNEINNHSSPIGFSIPPDYSPWSPAGDRVVIYAYGRRIGGFYLLADPNGTSLNPIGTNFSDTAWIATNLSGIPNQQYFAWSPDGTKAVFVMSEKIYAVDANGSNMKQLAGNANESYLSGVTWSHDGRKIAFSGKNLWIMNSDGTALRRYGDCWGRTWSPDDSRILCMLAEDVNNQYQEHLYLINVDSGNKTEIIKSTWIENLGWNPDGGSIIFASITEGQHRGIYLAGSQGKNIKLIHEESLPVERGLLDAISWNPSGNKIAFTSSENDGVSLYTINPDGTGKALLTSNLSWSWTNPYAWSPSGDKIVFSSTTINGVHIFIANPDGTGITQITTGEKKGYRLNGMGGSWSPDGRRLLIESISSRFSQAEVFIATLSGYDSTISRRTPVAATQDVRPANNSITIEEPQAGQTDATMAMPDTPTVSGFNIIFAAGILSAIYLIKRRYN